MARKIKKGPPVPPAFLFVQLLTPWLVMGIVAVLLSESGAGLEIILIGSLGCAIAATFLMRELDKLRRRRQARNGR